jgi:ATP-dependent Lhr-like helicase
LSALGQTDFILILRHMASSEVRLIEQGPDGTIMLGPMGERLVDSRDFYAIFPSDEEWRIVHNVRTLGTIPLANAVGVGSTIAFGGRRWRIMAVDDHARVLQVEPHRSATIPRFNRLGVEPIDDRLAGEMRSVLESADVPTFLDPLAQAMLAEARKAYSDLGLGRKRVLTERADVHAFTWRGSRTNDLLVVSLAAAGLDPVSHDIGVTVTNTSEGDLNHLLKLIADNPAANAGAISDFVENLSVAKYDELVPTAVLRHLWAARHSTHAKYIPALARELLSL